MTIRTGRPAGHGMFASELLIMDLWDAGRSIEGIARETGLMVSTVKKTVEIYRHRSTDRAWEEAARAASEQLVRAIAATGQSFA